MNDNDIWVMYAFFAFICFSLARIIDRLDRIIKRLEHE